MAEDEIVRSGKELHDRDRRSLAEPGNKVRFLVVDALTGDDETDRSALAKARNPNAIMFGVRIEYPTAYRIGRPARIGLIRS